MGDTERQQRYRRQQREQRAGVTGERASRLRAAVAAGATARQAAGATAARTQPASDKQLKQARSVDDVRAWLGTHMPGTTFALEGADLKASKALASEYAALAREYPEVARTIGFVGYSRAPGSRSHLENYQRALKVDPNAAADHAHATFTDKLANGRVAQLFGDTELGKGRELWNATAAARGTDPTAYMARHEFGHALEFHLEAHMPETYRDLVTHAFGASHAHEISPYATYSPHERFAEAFAANRYGSASARRAHFVDEVRERLREDFATARGPAAPKAAGVKGEG